MSEACLKNRAEWRDEAGFCILALAGNPACFGEDSRCHEKHPQGAWERIVAEEFQKGREARAATDRIRACHA